jgi:hypothetical protein
VSFEVDKRTNALAKRIANLIAEEEVEVNVALRALHIVALYIIEEQEKADAEQRDN